MTTCSLRLRYSLPVRLGFLLSAWVLAACNGPVALGGHCDSSSDCAGDAQCFANVCVPACQRNPECGDGYWCREGTCVAAPAGPGAACTREVMCKAGLSCQVVDDLQGTATCVAERPGVADGAACSAHSECTHGACMYERCVSLCQREEDCLVGEVCRRSPFVRDLAQPSTSAMVPPTVGHCLRDVPLLTYEVPIFNTQGQATWISVPSGALSMAIEASVDSDTLLVGAASLTAPSGQVLYQWPQTDAEFWSGARYVPTPRTTRLSWPPPTGASLQAGAYRADLGVFTPARLRVSVPARAQIAVRLAPIVALEVAIHILDTSDHPCAAAFDAASAEGGALGTAYVPALREILLQAGISVRRVTYHDIVDRGDLDEVDDRTIGGLIAASYVPAALNIYIVRALSPAGLAVMAQRTVVANEDEALASATGAFIAQPIAVSLAATCHMDWAQLARATAHELAKAAGLWPTVDLAGVVDRYADTPTTADNLLHPAEGGGRSLTASQRFFWREHMVVP